MIFFCIVINNKLFPAASSAHMMVTALKPMAYHKNQSSSTLLKLVQPVISESETGKHADIVTTDRVTFKFIK